MKFSHRAHAPETTHRRSKTAIRDHGLALACALFAIAMRLPHIGWGLPDIDEEALPLKKAFEMWGWDSGALTLDPQTAGWPSLSFYLHLALQHAMYFVGRLAGAYGDRYDFMLEHLLDKEPLLVLARSVGVVAMGVVAYVGARLATRLAGRRAGLLCGTMLALSPMLLGQAQLVTPDVLLTAFSALCIARIVSLGEHGHLRDYGLAGMWMGLGIACKYTPVLFAPSLYLVHLLRLRHEGSSLRSLGLLDRRLAWAALLCILAFVLTSPYTLTDLQVLRRDMAYQSLHLSQGHFGQHDEGLALVYYARQVLVRALGAPGLLLALAGLGAMAWRRRGPWLALLLCILPFYLGMSSLSTRFDRYMLPLVMPLSMGLAGAVLWLRESVRRGPRLLSAALLALLALVVLWPVARASLRYHELKSRPDTLRRAREYMLRELARPDRSFIMEAYTPRLTPENWGALRERPFFARLNPSQQARLLEQPSYEVDHIPMYSARVQLGAFYYDLRHYLPYDYIVISESVRGRYLADPERYPQQTGFYADLDRFGRLVKTFVPSSASPGPEIRIYTLDDRGVAALLRERGPLSEDFYHSWVERLHAPHFYAFLEGAAQQAAKKGMWEIAALYGQALVDSYLQGDVPMAARLALLERTAYSQLQAGNYAKAAQLGARYLARDPSSPRVASYRANALAQLGQLEDARQAYRKVLEIANAVRGQEQWAEWARRELERLDEPTTGPDGSEP